MSDDKAPEAAKNPPANVQSTKPVAPTTALVTDNSPGTEPAKNTTTDNTSSLEAAPNARGSDVTPGEQAELDRLFDEMDADDAKTDQHPMEDVMTRIRKIVAGTTNTPDDHTVWGAAGIKITLGDLRNLVRYVKAR